jgi:hypothetical protein
MSSGWFKLHRGWQDSQMFRSDKDKLNWLWLIERAVYVDEHEISINNSPHTLKRGQLSYSIRYLAKAWGCSTSYVRTYIAHLKKWHAIETQNRTGQTIITICNYSKFQDEQTENRTPSDENIARESHTNRTNNKKEKKEKKDNKDISSDVQSRFEWQAEELWNAYVAVDRPKGHKGKFVEQVEKHLKKGVDYEAIRAGIAEYGRSCQATGQKTQDAWRWIRDRRWEEDYTYSEAVNQPQAAFAGCDRPVSFASKLAAGEIAKQMLRDAGHV